MVFQQLTEVPIANWSATARQLWRRWDVQRTVVFSVRLTVRFRSVKSRAGLLVLGRNGWGECAPFAEYGAAESALWLRSALVGTPAVQDAREDVPVNVTIPVTSPEAAAKRVWDSGCATAKVKVADPRVSFADDVERVRAVAEALSEMAGGNAKLRIDVNGSWTVSEARRALPLLSEAASSVGGLEYVEQPCASVEELAQVRAQQEVPVAADESIRRATDPLRVVELEAADLAVIKVAPLGGVDRALELAKKLPIPLVVSSALDTSVGLAAGVQLGAALPELPFACGLDTARLLSDDVTDAEVISRDGKISVASARAAVASPLRPNSVPVAPTTVTDWQRRIESMIPHALRMD